MTPERALTLLIVVIIAIVLIVFLFRLVDDADAAVLLALPVLRRAGTPFRS